MSTKRGCMGLVLVWVISAPTGSTGGLRAQNHAELESIRIPVGEFVFDALAAGPLEGELVLLLHGFPQTSFAFRHQLRALAEAGFRAVAPDQRGYSPGARPGSFRRYAMGELVGDVLGLATALGADRFHLVGHDWGGAVAWVAAASRPDRIASLSVLSTPHFAALSTLRADSSSDQARRSSYFGRLASPGAESELLEDDAAALRAIYQGLPREAVERYLEVLGTPEALRAALAWYRAAFGSSASAASASPASVPRPIDVPTLYVWGEEDPSFGREAAEATAAHVAASYRFVPLAGAGHWLAEEAAEAVTEMVLAHVVSHPVSG